MSPARSKTVKTKPKTKLSWLIPITTSLVFLLIVVIALKQRTDSVNTPSQPELNSIPVLQATEIDLPTPSYKSTTSIEAALKNRRTRRQFEPEQVSLGNVSQLLWAAQGVNVEWGDRTAPSVKSTYPLSVYLVAHNIGDLKPGQYLYIPGEREIVHSLRPISESQTREAFFASLNQNSFKDSAGIIVITGNMDKMAKSYGGISHDSDVYIEAGHAAQNIYLQAESLKLGVIAHTGFDASIISNIITIPEEETLIYLIPFGKPKD